MLNIRLLGQFDLRLDRKRITIPSRNGQSLLAYLAITAGSAHRREKLAGMFWPDTTDENSRKYLRQELWRIRKAISSKSSEEMEFLIADEFSLAFNRDADYWLDVAQIEKSELEAQTLITTLALYQGEFLPGFYDDWVILERERIQSIFDVRMDYLLEELVASERWIAVQEWGERWLSLSGAREPAYRALMLASGIRGDMSRVASLYNRCRNELMENLGVDPSAETRALYEGLLKGAKVSTSSKILRTSGTITFLFTDIEGSTRLMSKLGDQYKNLLDAYQEVIRAAVQKWNGQEMDTLGDSFFSTFQRPMDAVQCAAEVQRTLIDFSWPQNETVNVRMGLHTGESIIRSNEYIGMDIHRATRIGDAGHGGQILLSNTTRDIVADDLPTGITIKDLGDQHLKDFKSPTAIYQLVVEGLPSEFLPLRSIFTGKEPPVPGDPPFKGLQYFDEADADLFFGRNQITEKLVDQISSHQRLSVVVGASGSGKSSVVRAGLVPALKNGKMLNGAAATREDTSSWQVHVITPTALPIAMLAAKLIQDPDPMPAAAALIDDMTRDPRSLFFFLNRSNHDQTTVLVIDQFEELFTLCRDEFEREAFIDNLLTALDLMEGRFVLIITLRADFYSHLSKFPRLRELAARYQEYIGPMTLEELRNAIVEPANRNRWEFESGLVDLILRDIGEEPGALPLLSHALLETWKRRAGHMLTLKGYQDSGGVHGAIAQTAENVYGGFSESDQPIVRNIFLRLTEFGEGTEDTRRRASLDELVSNEREAEKIHVVLNKLAEARLITLSEESAEVAHEALIREWPQLRRWLSEDREGILLHRRLTESAHDWELLEHDPGALYRGARLAQANEWESLHPQALNPQEKQFLEASNQLALKEQREREEARERELVAAKELAKAQQRSASRLRTRNRVITGIGITAVVFAMLALLFSSRANQNAQEAQANLQQALTAEALAEEEKENAHAAQATAEADRQRAEYEQKLATSRELAIAALDNLDIDPERSILLGLEALKLSDTPEAESVLHLAVQASRVRLILPHSDVVEDVTYSPDGTRLATASTDGTVKIWDADSGSELLKLPTGPINTISFNPSDGGVQLAVAYYEDKTASIWDTVTGKKLFTLAGHNDGINKIIYSPDGTRIATASNDHTLTLWDAKSGEDLLTLSGHTDVVTSVAFSPDGTKAASGGFDKTIRVWDLGTGQELLKFTSFSEGVGDVAFSPDGSIIAASTGGDEAVQLWDADTGQTLLTSSMDANSLVYDIAYSPDGSLIATSLLDGTARIWDTESGEELLVLHGHTSAVSNAEFSPDGTHLATVSQDRTARVWDITPEGSREWLTIAKHSSMLWRLAYSPDGTRIVTASFDRTAKVFDSATGVELLNLDGHAGRIYTAIFSPDGTHIATSSEDNTAKVWDALTGEEILTLSGHGDGIVGGFFPGILSVAYSPDGKQLATGGADGNIILWDAATGKQLEMFSNDGVGITIVAFSLDGKFLLSGTDQPLTIAAGEDAAVQLWELSSGQQVFSVTQPQRIWGLALNHDGTRIATAGFGGIVKIRGADTGEELFELTGLTSTIGGVAFSPDDSILATANGDGVMLWDANTGKRLLFLANVVGRAAAFSPDGTRLAIAGRDGAVHIYLLKINDLITLAESRVTRLLTTAECQQYLHMDTCPVWP